MHACALAEHGAGQKRGVRKYIDDGSVDGKHVCAVAEHGAEEKRGKHIDDGSVDGMSACAVAEGGAGRKREGWKPSMMEASMAGTLAL